MEEDSELVSHLGPILKTQVGWVSKGHESKNRCQGWVLSWPISCFSKAFTILERRQEVEVFGQEAFSG